MRWYGFLDWVYEGYDCVVLSNGFIEGCVIVDLVMYYLKIVGVGRYEIGWDFGSGGWVYKGDNLFFVMKKFVEKVDIRGFGWV